MKKIYLGLLILGLGMSLSAQKTTPDKTFWKEDFSQYDAIFLFQIGFAMKNLEEKIINEARPGTRIVSKYFKFPNLKPATSLDQVNLYIK